MTDTKEAVLNWKIITVEGSSYTGAKRKPEFCGSDIVIISKGSILGSLSYLNKDSSFVSPRSLSRRHCITNRSLNLKVGSGIRAGIKYEEYSWKETIWRKMGEVFDKISRVQADGKRGLHVVLYFLDFFICQWKYPSRSQMIIDESWGRDDIFVFGCFSMSTIFADLWVQGYWYTYNWYHCHWLKLVGSMLQWHSPRKWCQVKSGLCSG